MTSSARADWDMTPYFSGHGEPDYLAFVAALDRDISAVKAQIDEVPLTTGSAAQWAGFLAQVESVAARLGHLGSYLGCLGAADANDDLVKRDLGKLAQIGAAAEKLMVAVRAQLRAVDSETLDRLLEDERLRAAEYYLRRQQLQAARSMSEPLESLAADLAVDGLLAWGRLYDQMTGTLTFTLAVPGRQPEEHPVAMTRTFMQDPDPAVRRAAFVGSGSAWKRVADPAAACLNAIAGTRLTLYRQRGIDHYVEPALHDAGISRNTLDCLLDTVRSRQPLARDYLRKKAAALGLARLGYCDRGAPLPGEGSERVAWAAGCERIGRAFARAYPALADFSKMAIDKRWVDHAPRRAKRPGGFCSSSDIIGESRIFMTYNGAILDIQTLAHELGHAFHSYVMRDLRHWARDYPMTLAESASTFAENLVTNAALTSETTTDLERARILDTRMQQAEAFLLDIPTRFDFECALYDRRADRELSVAELCELMLDSQRANYGDAIDPELFDPWFWASKLHFYITEVSFYNFPYVFGYLFSMGLFSRYLEEGDKFLPRYERLLRATGTASAEEVARSELGVDLGAPDFWNASIDLIEADMKALDRLWPAES